MRRALVTGSLLLALYACTFAWGAAAASAAPVPTWSQECGGPDNLDPAACERLTYIASELSQIDANGSAASSAPATTSTVQLDDVDARRLDLIWWGVWISFGLSCSIYVFGRGWRSFKAWA